VAIVSSLSQRARLFILAAYVVILFCISWFVHGSWLPPTSDKGLWFYAGLAALLLGNLLVTPFFTKPVDAISNAVAAVVALLAVNVQSQVLYTGFDRFLWSATMGYVAAVLLASILLIALKGSANTNIQKFEQSLYIFSDKFGTPKFLFSAVFLFALVAFHRNTPREYLGISLAWLVIVGLQPLEALADVTKRWYELWRGSLVAEPFGEVVGHEVPGVVLVRHQQDFPISFGDILIVRAEDGKPGLAVALDYVGFSEGRWLRAAHLTISQELRTWLASMTSFRNPSNPIVLRANPEALGLSDAADAIWQRRDKLVGLVATDTDISLLNIEVVRTDLDLEEGRLVEVSIGTAPVLYQIVNGLTKEEIIQQKNTRGFVRAEAKKIGTWREDRQRFEIIRWVPSPNAPVFLVDTAESAPNRDAIGYLPGTNYHVNISDMNSLVTHNTAILGILGAGKTYLALELVERMIEAGIKVICLDLTNQYAVELEPYYPAGSDDSAIEGLKTIGSTGKTNFHINREEGGSARAFKEKVVELLRAFLSPTTPKYLRIYNPTQFEVWQQEGGRRPDGTASMASLTPTEITRIFTEATLQILQEQGMSDNAKCCLVFEEAHSLIPEWNAVASEGDKVATSGTAKAILQGRKYGLGCLVITQRTANVTKSILNQCNTIFALRVFDATGVEFLSNYIGGDYAGVLSTLEDRNAIVFGRASSCRNPVLIRLNNRDDFRLIFRAASGANVSQVS
jgi:hypothetical protein